MLIAAFFALAGLLVGSVREDIVVSPGELCISKRFAWLTITKRVPLVGSSSPPLHHDIATTMAPMRATTDAAIATFGQVECAGDGGTVGEVPVLGDGIRGSVGSISALRARGVFLGRSSVGAAAGRGEGVAGLPLGLVCARGGIVSS